MDPVLFLLRQFPATERAPFYYLQIVADSIRTFCEQEKFELALETLDRALNHNGWPVGYKHILLPKIPDEIRYEELWIWNYSRREFKI